MRYAQHAEAAGFEAVWQAESRLVREATIPLAAFGAATERIKLGSGVVSMWVRNPAFLAATFSTLDDLAPGRVILGIGAWWDPLAAEGRHRRATGRCGRCARSSTAVRALLANETVTFDGEFVHLDGVELDYVYQERRPKDVPIVHRRDRHADDGAHRRDRRRRAAQLPRVARLQRDRASTRLAEGAAKAGRTLDDIDRPQLVVCSMDDDRDAALDAARLLVTQYLGQQPHIMKASGVPAELLDEIGAGAHVAGHARAGGRRVEARARRGRADDHRVGHARRVPGQGGRVREGRAARARSSTRWAPTSST